MGESLRERRLLLEQIAEMYYIKGMSQEEIAEKVSMSRANISKLLKICVDQKIVEFKINFSKSPAYALAETLAQRYKLKKAIVVPSESHDELSKNNVGQQAAAYLESIIRSGMLVGVSCGTTLY